MHCEQVRREEGNGSRLIRTLMKPMSAAFSRKHWRQMFSPYLRMIPWLLLHTRLRGDARNMAQWVAHRRWEEVRPSDLGTFAELALLAQGKQ